MGVLKIVSAPKNVDKYWQNRSKEREREKLKKTSIRGINQYEEERVKRTLNP